MCLDSGEAGGRVWTCKGGRLGALAGLWSEGPLSIQDQNHKTFSGGFWRLIYAQCFQGPGIQ